MYISEFQIGNYKSFDESPRVQLAPGFNIITGQNNAGKTALLEALSLAAVGSPHRSLRTVPTPDSAPTTTSWIDVSITISRDELLEFMRLRGGTIQIATPNPQSVSIDNTPQGRQRFVEALFSAPTFTFALRRQCNQGANGPLQVPELPSFGGYKPSPASQGPTRSFWIVRLGKNSKLEYVSEQAAALTGEIGNVLAPVFQSHLYRFTAERFNLGRSQFGPDEVLLPDASNLPTVLNALQANVAVFSKLNRLLTEILPQVRMVSVRPVPAPNKDVEVLVWTIAPESGRKDLARPLSECGTGIGQVLAILYVALTAIRPQVVIVDEPQSFLHPGAIRKLIEVLKVESAHQYIMATHSPTVITAANPATISMLRLDNGVTRVESVDMKETRQLAACLNEVGARLSDVFGADNILWVEGATEELCFPSILQKIAHKPLMGTAIIGVRQVGDLEGRDSERIFDIYSRLSRTNSLLPPAVGFLFDSECRSSEQKDDLGRKSRRSVRFLPRRMFENYLLDPDAIAAVVNGIEGFRATPVTPEEVGRAIESARSDRKYYCEGQGPGADDWAMKINGAAVLKDIFNSLSESRVRFEKTDHSVALSEWLVGNKPDRFKEVSDLLSAMLVGKS